MHPAEAALSGFALCGAGLIGPFGSHVVDRGAGKGLKLSGASLVDALAIWQLARVPTTAQRLDQRGARGPAGSDG